MSLTSWRLHTTSCITPATPLRKKAAKKVRDRVSGFAGRPDFLDRGLGERRVPDVRSLVMETCGLTPTSAPLHPHDTKIARCYASGRSGNRYERKRTPVALPG